MRDGGGRYGGNEGCKEGGREGGREGDQYIWVHVVGLKETFYLLPFLVPQTSYNLVTSVHG